MQSSNTFTVQMHRGSRGEQGFGARRAAVPRSQAQRIPAEAILHVYVDAGRQDRAQPRQLPLRAA